MTILGIYKEVFLVTLYLIRLSIYVSYLDIAWNIIFILLLALTPIQGF